MLLVVEDDPTVARTTARVLSTCFEVAIASTRHEAMTWLDGLQEHPPPRLSAALVDVGLPDGSGLDVAERLLAARWKPVIAILTGTDDPTVASWAFARLVPLVSKQSCPPDVLTHWARAVLTSSPNERVLRAIERIVWKEPPTSKELETLRVALLEWPTPRKELAALRGVDEQTVKSQINSVLRKAGAVNLRDLRERITEDERGS